MIMKRKEKQGEISTGTCGSGETGQPVMPASRKSSATSNMRFPRGASDPPRTPSLNSILTSATFVIGLRGGQRGCRKYARHGLCVGGRNGWWACRRRWDDCLPTVANNLVPIIFSQAVVFGGSELFQNCELALCDRSLSGNCR